MDKCPRKDGKIFYYPGAQVCQECDSRYSCERIAREGRDENSRKVFDRYHCNHADYCGRESCCGSILEVSDPTD